MAQPCAIRLTIMATKAQLAKRIPVPDKNSINGNLNSPHNASVIKKLGLPNGEKERELRVTMQITPHIKATGNKHFLERFKKVMDEVKVKRPDLYDNLRTAGCFNIRPVVGAAAYRSNHSWGIAIDLYFGDAVVPRDSGLTEEGMKELYAFMHNAGFYWGAEFPTDDAMHWEMSLEWLLKQYG
jgi:hypothetical protein